MSSCNKKAPGGANKSIIHVTSSCNRKASGGGITPMRCCCHTEAQRLLYGKDVIISPLLGTAVASVDEKLRKPRCQDFKKRVLKRERATLSTLNDKQSYNLSAALLN